MKLKQNSGSAKEDENLNAKFPTRLLNVETDGYDNFSSPVSCVKINLRKD